MFVEIKEILPQYDADGNGSYTNAEITAAINGYSAGLPTAKSLTNNQKAILWQLFTGSTSGKNNPYSASVGYDIVSERKALKAELPKA